MHIHIITNSKSAGDRLVVILQGEAVYDGLARDLAPPKLFELLQTANGFEHIEYHDFSDAQIVQYLSGEDVEEG